MAMSKGKQISLVLVLGVLAVGLLAYRIPGVADDIVLGFEQGWNESRGQRTAPPAPAASSAPPLSSAKPPVVFDDLLRLKTTPDTVTAVREKVRMGRLLPQSEYTIGQHLDWSFRDPTWEVGTLPTGVQIARFEGGLSPDTAQSVRASLADYLSRAGVKRSRDELDDVLSQLQPGTALQLDFSLKSGGLVDVERLGVSDRELRELKVPLAVWLESIIR